MRVSSQNLRLSPAQYSLASAESWLKTPFISHNLIALIYPCLRKISQGLNHTLVGTWTISIFSIGTFLSSQYIASVIFRKSWAFSKSDLCRTTNGFVLHLELHLDQFYNLAKSLSLLIGQTLWLKETVSNWSDSVILLS